MEGGPVKKRIVRTPRPTERGKRGGQGGGSLSALGPGQYGKREIG